MTALSPKIEQSPMGETDSDLAVNAIDKYLKDKNRYRLIIIIHLLIVGVCGWYFLKRGFSNAVLLITIFNLLFVFIILRRKKKSIARLISLIDMTGLVEFTAEERDLDSNLQALKARIIAAETIHVKTQNRGGDEKGATWGKQDSTLDEIAIRRDAIEHGVVYDNLEGELTEGEKMVEMANQKYADMAEKRWQHAEKQDVDLQEYGVEKLSELLQTDYFEKHAKEGIFAMTAKHDDEGCEPSMDTSAEPGS
jgi:hypothetical protein